MDPILSSIDHLFNHSSVTDTLSFFCTWDPIEWVWVNSVLKSMMNAAVLESTSYSEPDRLDEEEVVRMSPTHSVCQYRRRKTFLGRSFFHSENCLTHLLRITDPDFLSTPESSKAKKDGESGLKMTTIVSLNSRGGGTTTCVTAKKSEIISFIGANNINGSSNGHNNNNNNNNNNSRGSTKDRANGANCSSSVENKCLMVGTTSSSNHSSGRPFMGVPDPNVNTSRALKLTLSKSDESFPRSAFWFLRQRTCGKGPGGCQVSFIVSSFFSMTGSLDNK